MSAMERVRAKGGHHVHLRHPGDIVALCGFKPQDKRIAARMMRERAGWWVYGAEVEASCKKCIGRAADHSAITDEISTPKQAGSPAVKSKRPIVVGDRVAISYQPGLRAIVEKGLVLELDTANNLAHIQGELDSGTVRTWDLGWIPLAELTRF